MRVERIPTLNDNYTYLVIDEATGEASIVDAPEAEPVIRRVEQLGVRVSKILSTHHHWDHVGANPDLAKRFGVPVFGHVSDSQRIPGFTQGLEEGDRVRVGDLEAQVLFIPAHTRGHIAYAFPGAVFCGDTLFAAGCGRVFDGTFEQLAASLERIAALPPETLCYCAHEYTLANLGFAKWVEPGNQALAEREQSALAMREAGRPTVPSRLADELATNPFLRTGVPNVRDAAVAAAGRFLVTGTEVFTALRRWKDEKYD